MDFWYSNTLHPPFLKRVVVTGLFMDTVLSVTTIGLWGTVEQSGVALGWSALGKVSCPTWYGCSDGVSSGVPGEKVSLVLSRFLRFLLYRTGCGQVVFLYHSGWFPLAALSNPYIFTILKIRQCPGSLVKVLFLPLLSIPKVDPGIFIESWLQQCLCHRQFWFEPSSHYT